jgi:hypothetical protein
MMPTSADTASKVKNLKAAKKVSKPKGPSKRELELKMLLETIPALIQGVVDGQISVERENNAHQLHMVNALGADKFVELELARIKAQGETEVRGQEMGKLLLANLLEMGESALPVLLNNLYANNERIRAEVEQTSAVTELIKSKEFLDRCAAVETTKYGSMTFTFRDEESEFEPHTAIEEIAEWAEAEQASANPRFKAVLEDLKSVLATTKKFC